MAHRAALRGWCDGRWSGSRGSHGLPPQPLREERLADPRHAVGSAGELSAFEALEDALNARGGWETMPAAVLAGEGASLLTCERLEQHALMRSRSVPDDGEVRVLGAQDVSESCLDVVHRGGRASRNALPEEVAKL